MTPFCCAVAEMTTLKQLSSLLRYVGTLEEAVEPVYSGHPGNQR